MKYIHSFVVDAPLDDVAQFHRESASMARITPPPIIVRVHSAPIELEDGDEMSFTLWMGPIPLHWTARMESVIPTGFIDRQIRGPFAKWVHRHIFVPQGKNSTTVVDVVEAQLSRQPFWRLAGFAMWIGMPLLFRYRAWKTRRLVRSNSPVRHRGPKVL
jgi:ligand-binding SRPBCC domain-containing protein